jgi:NAD+ synthase (glutamine-hydrolysing)
MKKIKIALAQMNPIVGDLSGNTRKILTWIKKAEAQKADLIVFPELAICGYPIWDLSNKQAFLKATELCLAEIQKKTKALNVTIALGSITPSNREFSKQGLSESRSHHRGSFNSLIWMEKGKIKSVQHKRLLPTYDVFLEDIFFQRGYESKAISWRGIKIGPTVCEDIWEDDYPHQPLHDLAAQGSELVVNVSASPFFRGVSDVRDSLLKRLACRYNMSFIYVNQVGAQDDLIFDGRSMIVNEKGDILFRAPAFKEGLFFCDFPTQEKVSLGPDKNTDSSEEMYKALTLGVRDYCHKNGFKKAILGLSGGIDSALTLALAVDALGEDAVVGVTMPGAYSSKGSWQDSYELAKRLGVECRTHPIKKKYAFMMKEYWKHADDEGHKVDRHKITLAMENLQARLRGMELMYLSNDEGRILLTTGNKSEMAMGYCTLYGDMAGGLAVLGDVYKTDVYRLCRYRNQSKEVIPESILNKAPSAELRPDQKDEDSLPPYEILDEILYHYIEKNQSVDDIVAAMRGRGISAAKVREVISKVDHNEYKRRQTAPILRVTQKAWFGRRMPITNRFRP